MPAQTFSTVIIDRDTGLAFQYMTLPPLAFADERVPDFSYLARQLEFRVLHFSSSPEPFGAYELQTLLELPSPVSIPDLDAVWSTFGWVVRHDDTRAFAEYLREEPLIPIQQSPLDLLSFVEVARLGFAALGGFVNDGSAIPGVLSVSGIAAVIGTPIYMAAKGVGKGLERSLEEIVHDRMTEAFGVKKRPRQRRPRPKGQL